MPNTPENRSESGPRLVSAVETSCSIIEALDRMGAARVSDVADAVDRSKGTVYTHLATLKAHGLVTKRGSLYELSLRLWHTGQRVYSRMDLLPGAVPALRQLADSAGLDAHLLVEQNGRGYVLHRERARETYRTPFASRTRFHLHYLAGGKAILASLSLERVGDIIDDHGLPERTANTITDRDSLARELETVREQGFAVDKQEHYRKLRCVGAPVKGPDDRPVGAAAVSGPVSQMQGERFERDLPELVVDTATTIELQVELSRSSE